MTKGPLASYGPEIVDMIGKTWFFKLPLESNGKNILGLVWFMVFNATFNNISVISWQSVLLVEETRVHRKPPICLKSLTEHTFEDYN